MNICWVRIVSGELHQFLNGIDIVGSVDNDGSFVVYGCKKEDEPKFYEAILSYDNKVNIQGFESVEEVKEWWEEYVDMVMFIDKGDFEVITINGF